MTAFALLNTIDHHDLRVALDDWAALGAAVNQALIFPTEFEDAQRDYPIVLRRQDDGDLHAVVLLGLDRDENLFLDADGWGDRYIPALMQSAPFAIGLHEREDAVPEPMVHIDLDHPAIGRKTGEPLFLPHGGNAPYLEHMNRVLRRAYDGRALAGPLYAAWEEAGLIEPITLRLSLDETTRYDVPDCLTIAPQRLATLDGATLERLNRAGYLRPAFMVAASLGNVGRLIERKNSRRRAPTPAA
jgi:hypothetical protein